MPDLGSIETWDFCIDNEYDHSYLSFSGYERAKKMMDGYWQRAKRGARAALVRGGPAAPRRRALPARA